MTPSKAELKGAKAYIDQQLAIMKKYGSAPKLSKKKYEALISKVAMIGARCRASARAAIKAEGGNAK